MSPGLPSAGAAAGRARRFCREHCRPPVVAGGGRQWPGEPPAQRGHSGHPTPASSARKRMLWETGYRQALVLPAGRRTPGRTRVWGDKSFSSLQCKTNQALNLSVNVFKPNVGRAPAPRFRTVNSECTTPRRGQVQPADRSGLLRPAPSRSCRPQALPDPRPWAGPLPEGARWGLPGSASHSSEQRPPKERVKARFKLFSSGGPAWLQPIPGRLRELVTAGPPRRDAGQSRSAATGPGAAPWHFPVSGAGGGPGPDWAAFLGPRRGFGSRPCPRPDFWATRTVPAVTERGGHNQTAAGAAAGSNLEKGLCRGNRVEDPDVRTSPWSLCGRLNSSDNCPWKRPWRRTAAALGTRGQSHGPETGAARAADTGRRRKTLSRSPRGEHSPGAPGLQTPGLGGGEGTGLCGLEPPFLAICLSGHRPRTVSSLPSIVACDSPPTSTLRSRPSPRGPRDGLLLPTLKAPRAGKSLWGPLLSCRTARQCRPREAAPRLPPFNLSVPARRVPQALGSRSASSEHPGCPRPLNCGPRTASRGAGAAWAAWGQGGPGERDRTACSVAGEGGCGQRSGRGSAVGG